MPNTDYFMKLDGIPGESTDMKHTDWIELDSFSHGISHTGGSHRAEMAAGADRVNHQDFTVVHRIDAASPTLASFCCQGRHIKEVKIELCRAAGDKETYMEYRMTDTIVSSVRPVASRGVADAIPLEEVSFNYATITWRYMKTLHGSGRTAGQVQAGWNVAQNRPQ